MIEFDELNTLPDRTITLYEKFHASVIEDMARRLSELNILTATTRFQLQRLQAAGAVYDDVIEELAELTGVTEEALREAFKNAGVKTLKYDDAIYREAGFEPTPLRFDRPMMEVLAAGYRKTRGHLRNLTRTTALTAQASFIEAADLAHMQVATGAFDYDTAIKNAVLDVADRGLTVIHYPSGHRDQLDVATRRAVLTGVSQTASEVQLQRLNEMDVGFVAVSAHVGARNEGTGPKNHESWQGKIYAIDGPRDGYDDFVTTTGYGTGEGLHGWNCVVGDTRVSATGIRAAYRREYAGEIIIIRTAGGKKITVTPNHPIRTKDGWVPAGLLNEGDNIICRSLPDGIGTIRPDVNEKETSIKDIFDSFTVRGKHLRFPASSGYFHGDISDGEVEVVFPDRFLRDSRDVAIFKHFQKVFFRLTSWFPGTFVSEGPFSEILFRAFHATDSFMSWFSKLLDFFLGHSIDSILHGFRTALSDWYAEFIKIFSNSPFRYAGGFGDFFLPHPRFVHFKQVIGGDAVVPADVGFPIGPPIDTVPLQAVDDGLDRAFMLFGNRGKNRPGVVEIDHVVFVKRKFFAGHVYNLETKGGWYYSNDIITHNCRHSFYPFIPGISPEPQLTPEAFAGKTVTYQDQEVDFYRATQKQRRIERQIRKAKREKMALEAADQDPGVAVSKIRKYQAKMRDFIDQTGLKRHYEREQVRY